VTLPRDLMARFDPASGRIEGLPVLERRLSDLKGCFLDERAYALRLEAEDPVVYTVTSAQPDTGEGALHYGLGWIAPGRVGDEYFLTKGHLHAWRPAAELYVGLAGEGLMLLEHEATGECRALPLTPQSAVYVPGHTAHRTVNVGDAPLTYLGIYPAEAGHDYGALARTNFRQVVLKTARGPQVMERGEARMTRQRGSER
jgi:glucose-6-phosphate isomerase, archaeal